MIREHEGVSDGAEKTEAGEAQADAAETDAAEPDATQADAAEPDVADADAADADAIDGDPERIGEGPDAVFDALWKRVIAAWDDDKPHQLALSYALEHEMLPEIAGRYRKLVEDPDRGPRAKKKLDAIVVAATQMLMATKTAPRQSVPWQWTASAAVFFIVVVAFLAYKILLVR